MSVIVDLDPTAAETLRTALGADAEVLVSIDALRRHGAPQAFLEFDELIALGPVLASVIGGNWLKVGGLEQLAVLAFGVAASALWGWAALALGRRYESLRQEQGQALK